MTSAKTPPVVPASKLGAREAALRRARSPLLRFLHVLGPGVTVGASDDDPSGIGTYAVAGAAFGYATLWIALITLPLMSAVQYISAKIGLVSGRGISELLRLHYPRWLTVGVAIALLAANTINAGADIGAIAASINLLLPRVPAAALIIPTGVAILAFQIWGSYRLIAMTFKWLTLTLFAYVAAAFFAHPNWAAVTRGTFVPSLSSSATYVSTIVAILGTTISPYMIAWQARQEVEEDIDLGRRFLWQRKGTTKRELRFAAVDIGLGMFFSNLVMYFIILTTGATLHASGEREIATAADAARALVPLAGHAAGLLFAIGMIGVGVLAVPILTASSAYVVAGAFGWKAGLSHHPWRAPAFYSIIAASTLVGAQINFLGVGAVAALFWTAVINGFLAPVVLVSIMLIANNRKIMGERVNGPLLNVLGWATTCAMTIAAIALVVLWGH